MPSHRGVSVALNSQYDALTIPETAGTESSSSAHVTEVSIPTYPSSQFWLSYTCQSPLAATGCRFYYFKLSINGESVVSWGVGEDDNWAGKTMFGLFESGTGTDFEGRKIVEKRGFFFSNVAKSGSGIDGGLLEVRVYRSKARRREKIALEALGGLASPGDAVR